MDDAEGLEATGDMDLKVEVCQPRQVEEHPAVLTRRGVALTE